MLVEGIKSMPNPHPSESTPAWAVPEGKDQNRGGARPKTASQVSKAGWEEGELARLVKRINDLAAEFRRHVAFEVHRQTGKTVIKVIDDETKEVIRQIPPAEMLGLMARMTELAGLIFNNKA